MELPLRTPRPNRRRAGSPLEIVAVAAPSRHQSDTVRSSSPATILMRLTPGGKLGQRAQVRGERRARERASESEVPAGPRLRERRRSLPSPPKSLDLYPAVAMPAPKFGLGRREHPPWSDEPLTRETSNEAPDRLLKSKCEPRAERELSERSIPPLSPQGPLKSAGQGQRKERVNTAEGRAGIRSAELHGIRRG